MADFTQVRARLEEARNSPKSTYWYGTDITAALAEIDCLQAALDAQAARLAEAVEALNEWVGADAVDPWPDKTKNEWQQGYWAALRDQADFGRAILANLTEKGR